MANDLGNLLNELVMQTGGASASPAALDPMALHAMKVRNKEQMAGLANTQTGIDILKQIVNNTSVDIVERTAAAEVLNPGTVVNFDGKGGVIFNSPSVNTNYNPELPYTNSAGMDQAQKVEVQSNTTKKTATVPELLNGINTRFAQIQSETDPVLVAEGMATLNQSIADFKASRAEELKAQSRKLFGLDAFEQQIETDRRLDMQESQELHGVEYLGMSEASQATYQQMQLATGKANEWLQLQIETDPTLAAVNTKAKYLESYANAKFGELSETQATSGIADLVSSTAIDATLTAIGTNPATATPEQRRQVSLQIQAGNGYYNEAQVIGTNPNQLPLYISNGGPQALMAKNVLVQQAGGNEQLANDMINAYNNFETFAELSPEELEARGLIAPTKIDAASIAIGANTKEARAKQEASIKLARWNFVREAYNKQASSQMYLMEGFEPPQSNALSDFTGLVEGLTSARASTKDTSPVTLPEIVQRMTWPTDTLEAERKEEALVDYIYYESQKKGNPAIGLPNEFGNRNLIKSFVQANRIQSKIRDKTDLVQTLGYFGGALTQFGGLAGMAIGIPTIAVAQQTKNKGTK